MQFQDLGLPSPLLKALADEGYEAPTPIQAQAIPPIVGGADLLGIAQTGTGKTAAFALPILARLEADRRPAPRRGCRALILSPTRELAAQIGASFKTYGRHLGFRVAVVFGGVSMRAQIEALARGVDILVATPGRLIDHMDSRNAVISGTEIFVLDEADQMLDLGFFRPIRKIVGHLSARRQNLFFSATMPPEIAKLADELLVDPVKVAVAPVATTAERVEQRVIHVEHAQKRGVLVELLADPDMARTLVFARTKRGADRVAQHLDKAGISSAAIHGNKSQRQREEALDAFKSAKVRVLVATDIAARGIDIDAVSHVVNFELPEVPEAYVHRIGRTARAGASGSAISLCDGEERSLLRAIERLTRQVIPAEDRRNDQSISLDAPGSGSGRQSNRRGNGRQDRGRDRAAGDRAAAGFRARDDGRRRPAYRDDQRSERSRDGGADRRRSADDGRSGFERRDGGRDGDRRSGAREERRVRDDRAERRGDQTERHGERGRDARLHDRPRDHREDRARPYAEGRSEGPAGRSEQRSDDRGRWGRDRTDRPRGGEPRQTSYRDGARDGDRQRDRGANAGRRPSQDSRRGPERGDRQRDSYRRDASRSDAR